jgi:hypothetical protein
MLVCVRGPVTARPLSDPVPGGRRWRPRLIPLAYMSSSSFFWPSPSRPQSSTSGKMFHCPWQQMLMPRAEFRRAIRTLGPARLLKRVLFKQWKLGLFFVRHAPALRGPRSPLRYQMICNRMATNTATVAPDHDECTFSEQQIGERSYVMGLKLERLGHFDPFPF